MRFVDPKNDVAFKKIFGDEQHKEILIAFLNAVLDLKGVQEIADIEILNPYQAPKLELLKYTLLDLRAVDKRGVTFIVEMQVEEIEGYKKRFQYYAAKAYAGQIERGEEYVKLNQVIFIGILNFNAFASKHYLSRHLLLNLETQDQDLYCGCDENRSFPSAITQEQNSGFHTEQHIGDIEFNFIELPKFKKQEEELTTLLDKWTFFIKHAGRLDVIPENTNTPELKSAYDVAERFRWSKEELEVYDYWSMKLQDERGALAVAERRGLEAGHKAGLEAGRKEGVTEGEKATRMATARALLADGMETALVAKYTGLSLAELAQL